MSAARRPGAEGLPRRTLLGAGVAGVAGLVAPAGCARADPRGGSFLLHDVRVFDGERLLDADSIRVEDGEVAAIGRSLPRPEGMASQDGGGGTVLPGLIDAHAHVNLDARVAAPRFGVTTLLDMFTTNPTWLPGAASDRAEIGSTNRADVWSAGVGATAPGGWPDFGNHPTLGPADDPYEFVATRIAEGSDYLKVFIEEGGQFDAPARVSLRPEQVSGLITAAHQQGIRAVVHVSTCEAAVAAATAGADALVHGPYDRLLTEPELAQLQRAGLPVVATLSVLAPWGCDPLGPRLRDNPLVTGWLSAEQIRGLSQHRGAQCLDEPVDRARRNVTLLHEAGVPILAGADAPNPGTAHGISTLGELMLLVEARLTPTQALTAATAGPAAAFGVPRRGRIAVSHRADLVLVAGDPTTDITAMLDIVAVWKNGHPIDRRP